ncbi:hypothetical protein Hs30E_19490 [Lactococcus hodotermopsidis]|uniref:HTH cro/C1-type domain-containing protein n=1 Tax=Pseudolactococcus hodotermopsidis TaxID=2709157 RepID=A0A6A0BGB4_9LACT|nr:helix-turn-helix transcriptional regulator [Lactococcus hodotermopsidis]GFH43398.1 hypothetical protein Hs30E_19490 [Lactococcus hodotermopsidis]
MIIFQERLKSVRLERSLTQKQLAELAKITEAGLQNYENGRREPKLSIAINLADALNVSLDYLVGRTDKKEINL